jgi:hypothetical protein
MEKEGNIKKIKMMDMMVEKVKNVCKSGKYTKAFNTKILFLNSSLKKTVFGRSFHGTCIIINNLRKIR